jgi:DNA polymerase-3 subunit delta'
MREGTGAWGLIGHGRAVGLLEQSLASGRVSHAYLISGPRQIGKTTLALAFARAANCEAPRRPCGECQSCRRIAKGVHTDVQILKLRSGREAEGAGASGRQQRDEGSERGRRSRVKTISMEEIRAMLRDVVLAPYEGRRKVYVIRYAEDLSLEAIQTLLKTLEEPPAHVVLILTTVDDKILPLTVVSRCQRISLGLVPIAEIERALRERHGASEEQAHDLAHLSGGRVGWALDALRDPRIVEARRQRLKAFLEAAAADRVERLAFAEQLATEFGRDPESAMAALELWLSWWRDVLLTKHGRLERVINEDRKQELREQAARFQLGQLFGAMRGIRTALRQLQQNVNPRLALEVLMLEVPSGAK